MIRTVLVDDDYIVRTFMRNIVDWKAAGFEIISDVQDGEQAYDVIKKENPDLIITDISMPVMDGIELIKKLKEEGLDPVIVVLSCHDDFDYVREAMKLGADDYILKNTFNKKNIDTIFAKFYELVERKQEKQTELLKMKKMAEVGKNELKNEFLNNIIKNKYDYSKMVAKGHSYNIDLSLVNTYVVLIKVHKKKNILENQGEKLERYMAIYDIVGEILEERGKFELVILESMLYMLVLDGGEIEDSNVLRSMISDLYKMVSIKVMSGIIFAVSDKCIGKESLQHAYLHAKAVLNEGFYKIKEVFYYRLTIYEGNSVKVMERNFFGALVQLKLAKDVERIIEKCLGKLKEFELAYVAEADVIRWLQEVDRVLEVVAYKRDYYKIHHINDVVNMIQAYEEIIIKYPFVSKKVKNPLVASALNLMIKNFDQLISLSSIADELNVNSTYLSRLFKQEIEMNFIDYLTQYRIEYAKGLLVSTDLKVNEISEKCGFLEYRYFCKVFKRLVGDNSNGYRRSMR